ncbi:MAG: hypothetical protein ACJ8M1_01535 [Chthoniobacterales bacterium]
MSHRFPVTALTAAVAIVTACSKPNSTATSESAGDVGAIDACSLLNPEEIRSVQGEAVTEQKPSGNDPMSQCYFATTTPVNSVVITVVRLADTVKQGRSNWEKMLKAPKEEESEGKAGTDRDQAGREKEEERAQPQKIEGVGDDAFWVGNRFGGALYILKANRYVRVSVGGADDQAGKIKKSKTLAEMALKRL